MLLTKLSRKNNVSDIIALADFFLQPISVIDNIEELKKVEIRLRNVKGQEMERIARHCFAPGLAPDRLGARNAAACIVCSFVQGSLDLQDNRIRQKVMTDVLFIVSHAKTFGPRMRTHAWNELKRIVLLTNGQQKQFERWTSPDALKFEINRDDENYDSQSDGECSSGSIHHYFDECDY